MKRILTIVPLLLLTLAAAGQKAEDHPQSVVNWGIKAQANLSAFRIKNIPTMPDLRTRFEPGAELGGYLDFNITRRFYIQFGLMGSYEQCEVDFGNRATTMQSVALEVPIYALWRWGNEQKGWFSMGVGSYTEFVLSGDIDGSNPYRHVITDQTTGDSSIVTGDNLSGLAFMVGYELPCGLQLNASYHYGLSDLLLFEHDSRTTYQRPHKFTLGLGWRF
ncbi:MAG: PorT family protein [Bacteroidales bacterium]|nr:PorT family protein [Bacteroidales bacterium]